jgi:hypothetical protein
VNDASRAGSAAGKRELCTTYSRGYSNNITFPLYVIFNTLWFYGLISAYYAEIVAHILRIKGGE